MSPARLVHATSDDWRLYRDLWLRMFHHRPDEYTVPGGESPEAWPEQEWRRRMVGDAGEGRTMAILSEDRWLAMATVFVEEDGERIAYLRESFIDLTADDSEWLTVSRPLIDEFFRLLVAEGIARVYTDTLADRPRVIRYLEATGARRTGVERPSATGDIPAVEFVWDIAEIAPQSASTN